MSTTARSTLRRTGRATYVVLWTTLTALVYAVGLVAATRELTGTAVFGLFAAAALVGASCAISLSSMRPMSAWRITGVAMQTGVVTLAVLGLTGISAAAGLAALVVLHLVSPRMLTRLGGLVRRHLGLRSRVTPDASSAQEQQTVRSVEVPSWPSVPPIGSVGRLDDPTPGDPSPATLDEPPTRSGRNHHPSRSARTDRHGRRAHRDRSAAEAPPEVPAEVLDFSALEVPDHMDEQDLCRAWQSSYLALQRSRTLDERLRAVRVRQACLDELERRDAPALHAWLDAGARAASAPTKYLTTGGRRPELKSGPPAGTDGP